jgi:hypothetical protein
MKGLLTVFKALTHYVRAAKYRDSLKKAAIIQQKNECKTPSNYPLLTYLKKIEIIFFFFKKNVALFIANFL